MSSTDPLPRAESARPRRLRDTLVLVGLFALVLAGLAALAAATGWEETWAQITRLKGWQLLVLLGLSLVNYVLRGLRWHLFARRLGLGTSLITSYRHFFGGFAMSVTPGRVGELVRMRWIGRETGFPFETTAPLMLVDRASDLAATGLLLGVALAFSTTGIAFGIPVTVLAVAAALLVTRPGLLAGLAGLGHRITGRFGRLFAKLRRAAEALAMFSSPGLMGAAGLLGIAGWFAEGVGFYLLLGWMGADIDLTKAVAIFVFAGIAGGLTGAPGGVGGAEAAMVALLTLEGVGLEASVPATAIIRVTTLWFAILIGLFVFPIAEKYSLRKQDVVERD
jgi:uncharacterized protein (TIRG00374 family)